MEDGDETGGDEEGEKGAVRLRHFSEGCLVQKGDWIALSALFFLYV